MKNFAYSINCKLIKCMLSNICSLLSTDVRVFEMFCLSQCGLLHGPFQLLNSVCFPVLNTGILSSLGQWHYIIV